ncbi:MAG TPA: adenosylcobinamide amidohydrolase [Smithellaceae bacterium]|nr:adenosylcobinamide amidohydrolase [Smithellaceae bacterium]
MRKLIVVVLTLVMLPALLLAADIQIPENLRARAYVLKAERDGLWEKSLIVQFAEKRRTLGTLDGFVDAYAVLNHSAHPLLWQKVSEKFMSQDGRGGKLYTEFVQQKVADDLKLKKSDINKMATAANMDNLAVVTKEFKPFTVTVLATGGARTNAIRTGVDESSHIEGEEPKGTINIMLLTNAVLTDGAMARAIITMTEAKTAALEDLKVPSSYTKSVQATGTGTDSIIVVSGVTGPKATYTGGHSKIGEMIGKATYEAVVEALGKQNGFLLPGAKPYVTENSRREKLAKDSAIKWLKMVDDSRFADSWKYASKIFRQSVQQEQWITMINSARNPLGKQVSRQFYRSLYTKKLPGVPDGEYVIIEFNTVFENKTGAIETVTSKLEDDGIWKISGYFIK